MSERLSEFYVPLDTLWVISETSLSWQSLAPDWCSQLKQESPANAKGTRDSSACMKAHCEQM